jgi:cytochrome c oxidase assembly factor CtaG
MAELGPLALIAAAAAAYAAGVARAWERAGRGRLIHRRNVVWFTLGLAAALAVLVGPVDARADHNLTVHMVQHVVLLSIAAPLLAAGEPFTALLWAFDDGTRARVAPWWRRVLRSQRGRGWVVWIGATLFVQTVALFVWHFPGPYDAAVRHPLVHGAEHLSFLLTSIAFWWVIACSGWRSRQGAAVLALFAAWFPATGLGVAMTLAKTSWYPAYTTGHAAAALRDQQMAGVVMWGVGGFVAILAATLVFATWLAGIERRHPAQESVVVPPLEAVR